MFFFTFRYGWNLKNRDAPDNPVFFKSGIRLDSGYDKQETYSVIEEPEIRSNMQEGLYKQRIDTANVQIFTVVYYREVYFVTN